MLKIAMILALLTLGGAANATAQVTFPEGVPLEARSYHAGVDTDGYWLAIDGRKVDPYDQYARDPSNNIHMPIPPLTPGTYKISMAAFNEGGESWSEPQTLVILPADQPPPPPVKRAPPAKPTIPDILVRP